jgi:3-methyladenine DNA glycosylase AlkD
MTRNRTAEEIVAYLKASGDPERVEGMARFGIRRGEAVGVPMPELRKLAREIGKDQGLAGALWLTGLHEARILATIVAEPRQMTEAQMDGWVADIDSWDLCDQACGNLFIRSPYAYQKANEWSRRPEEFVRRAGFAMIAYLAVHDKKAPDERLREFFPLIVEAADDERNFVKKAVNWALRALGKRSRALNQEAVRVAGQLKGRDSRSARWIGSDALRELEGEGVQARLNRQP